MQQAKKATPAVKTGKATKPNFNAFLQQVQNPKHTIYNGTSSSAWGGYVQTLTANIIAWCGANGGVSNYSIQPITAHLQGSNSNMVKSYYLTTIGSGGNVTSSKNPSGFITTAVNFVYPKSPLVPKALQGTTQTLLNRGAMLLYLILGTPLPVVNPTTTGNASAWQWGTTTNNLAAVQNFMANGFVSHLGAKLGAQHALAMALTGCSSPNQVGINKPLCQLVYNG